MKNKWIRWVRIFALLIVMFSGAQMTSGKTISVIPKPGKITPVEGTFTVSPTTIIAVGENGVELGEYVQALLSPATGFPLPLEQWSDGKPPPGLTAFR